MEFKNKLTHGAYLGAIALGAIVYGSNKQGEYDLATARAYSAEAEKIAADTRTDLVRTFETQSDVLGNLSIINAPDAQAAYEKCARLSCNPVTSFITPNDGFVSVVRKTMAQHVISADIKNQAAANLQCEQARKTCIQANVIGQKHRK